MSVSCFIIFEWSFSDHLGSSSLDSKARTTLFVYFKICAKAGDPYNMTLGPLPGINDLVVNNNEQLGHMKVKL